MLIEHMIDDLFRVWKTLEAASDLLFAMLNRTKIIKLVLSFSNML
jgi:hypothetical protein